MGGLNAGADDYQSKPFSMVELLSPRARALQRRQHNDREPVLKVGAYRFDPQSGQLQISTSADVVTITLAGKEQQLMACFLKHSGQIIPGSRL